MFCGVRLPAGPRVVGFVQRQFTPAGVSSQSCFVNFNVGLSVTALLSTCLVSQALAELVFSRDLPRPVSPGVPTHGPVLRAGGFSVLTARLSSLCLPRAEFCPGASVLPDGREKHIFLVTGAAWTSPGPGVPTRPWSQATARSRLQLTLSTDRGLPGGPGSSKTRGLCPVLSRGLASPPEGWQGGASVLVPAG